MITGILRGGLKKKAVRSSHEVPLTSRRLWGVPFFAEHWVALCVPWLMILAFSLVPLSEFSRPVSPETYQVVMIFIGCYLIGTLCGRKNAKVRDANLSFRSVRIGGLTAGHVAFSIANVLIAGNIPLFSAIQGGQGDASYIEFGLTGVYGFYLAYSNFLGLLAFYNFLVTKQTRYLAVVGWIMFVLVIFITRQNVVSLLVEMFVLFMLLRGGLSTLRLLFYVICVLIGFSMIGGLRTLDIRGIARIGDEWYWVPDFVIWLYSYSYFNLLNLDNMIRNVGPSYDGGALLQMVPNFVKNALSIVVKREGYLEVSNFTVSSAVSDLYADSGYFSIIAIPIVAGIVAQRLLHKWVKRFDVRALFSYCVLYFCGLFSFFVNFWFYLPIIFQIVFVYVFLRKKTIRLASSTGSTKTRANSRNMSSGGNASITAVVRQPGAKTP